MFDVKVLERHPFTPQTFVPMGTAREGRTKYLVIVAPTLPSTSISTSRRNVQVRPRAYPVPEKEPRRSIWERFTRARPSPYTNSQIPPPPPLSSDVDEEIPQPKGSGLPDLENLCAFIVDGSQAVTYGPGTWHAPMVVIGDEAIDFVVLQYANGVADEDCQEVLLESREGKGIEVILEEGRQQGLGLVRARL